jgi:hypothetical protein
VTTAEKKAIGRLADGAEEVEKRDSNRRTTKGAAEKGNETRM